MSEKTTQVTVNRGTKKKVSMRKLTGTAMLSAIAYVLMFLDFSVPFMPSFIKMDLSELPALIGSFAYGPVAGVIICLIKNVLHLFITTTGGVGELSNFLLGASFVLVAGGVYHFKKTRTGALIGSVLGAVLMGLFSILSNYYLVYPIYYNFMPKEAVLAVYQDLFKVNSIEMAILIYNVPFTFIKGLISVVLSALIYQPLRPLLKGKQQQS